MKRLALHALLIAAVALVALPATAQADPGVEPAPEPVAEASPCAPAMTPAEQPEPVDPLAASLGDGPMGSTLLSSGCNAGSLCKQSSQCYCYDYLCACINRECTCIAEG